MSMLFSSLSSTGHGMSMLFSDGPFHFTAKNSGTKSENSVLNPSTNPSDDLLVYKHCCLLKRIRREGEYVKGGVGVKD